MAPGSRNLSTPSNLHSKWSCNAVLALLRNGNKVVTKNVPLTVQQLKVQMTPTTSKHTGPSPAGPQKTSVKQSQTQALQMAWQLSRTPNPSPTEAL